MIEINKLRFDKLNGLLPVCIQDARTLEFLMLGFMNQEALQKTLETKRVTFYSRSKQRLWTKGESSGNHLELIDLFVDCDQDTLLIKAIPAGPVCHTGATHCFTEMMSTIDQRRASPQPSSYTCELLNKGTAFMAQKIGEEGVEVALAAVTRDNSGLLEEVADLIFHLGVLLRSKELSFEAVYQVLEGRRSMTVWYP